MKFLIICILFVFIICIHADTYYFDNNIGDDSRGFLEATSPNTPWKSLQKFNTIQSSLESGDSVLFKRGQRWNGFMNMTINKGTPLRPIVIGSYGPESDPLPILSGAIPITNWTRTDDFNNLPLYYAEVTFPNEVVENPTLLFVNNKRMTFARTPNKGEWYRVTGVTENGLIDSSRNESDGYWNGATIRARTSFFSWEHRTVVNSYSSGTFNLETKFTYLSETGYGYFIDGKMELIDTPGEWYYDSVTKRLYLSPLDGQDPNKYQVDAVVYPNVISVTGVSHVTVTKIQVQYSTKDLILVRREVESYGLIYDQCVVRFAGGGGFQLDGARSAIVQYCDISNIDGIGVDIGNGASSGVLGNRVTDIGLEMCYGDRSGGISAGSYGSGQTIKGNFLNNIGYVGIAINSLDAVAENNYINNSQVMLSGTGGIYSYGETARNMKIINNIVTYVYGGVEGMPIGSQPEGYGIVVAEKVRPAIYENNTVAFCRTGGIQIKSAHDLRFRYNLLYGSDTQISFFWKFDEFSISNNLIENNVLINTKSGQVLVKEPESPSLILSQYNKNFYCNPFSGEVFQVGSAYLSLNEWMNRPGIPDNVSRTCSFDLKDYKVEKNISLNILTDGTFETLLPPWTSVPEDAVSIATQVNGFNSSCLLLNVSSQANFTQASTPPFMSSTKMFEVSFQAKSSIGRKVSLPLVISGTSEVSALEFPSLVVTSEVEQYNVLIEKNSSSTSEMSLNFLISDSVESDLYIDNVVVNAVEGRSISPFQIFYNIENSAKTFTLPPGDYYLDIDGNVVENTFVLAPYTSKVLLFKESTAFPDEKDQKDKNNSAIIGSVVGVIIFLLLVAFIVGFLLWRKRRANNISSEKRESANKHFSIELVGKGPWDSSTSLVSPTSGFDPSSYETLPSVNGSIMTLGGGDYAAISSLTPVTSSPSSKASITKGVDIKNDWVVDYSELQIEYEIGRGAYGIVYKAKWRASPVAVKKMIMEDMSQKDVDNFYRETLLMKNLRPSPNVVTLIGVCEHPLGLITEFYEYGSLHTLLLSDEEITLPIYKRIILGMARGMHHLHMEKIIHRDLAARNVLLAANYEPKISDFGLSRVAGVDGGKTESTVGPLLWMAPESLEKHTYSAASDVWSFGITLVELFTRANPYDGLGIPQFNIASRVMRGKLTPPIPRTVPKPVAQIMEGCFKYNPSDRPNFKTICHKLETEFLV